MTGKQLPKQRALIYQGDEHGRIPRRRSATVEELRERRQATQGEGARNTNAPAASQRQAVGEEREDDEVLEEGYNPYRLPNSSRRYYALPTQRQRAYEIPLSDGTVMHVNERELSTMPDDYRRAAQMVIPQPQIPAPVSRSRRQPNPRRPVQDDSVIEVGPAGARETEGLPRQRRRRFHWLVGVGFAMFIMILGWLAISVFDNWWQEVQDYWHFGMPRTYQTDANVGHGTAKDPTSHFIAENLHKHIIVIEIPGDDASKSKIYLGPTLLGPGQELAPVTLSFEDVNHDGHPDLVIHVEDTSTRRRRYIHD